MAFSQIRFYFHPAWTKQTLLCQFFKSSVVNKDCVFSPSSELPSSDYADDEDDNDDEQEVDSEGKEDTQNKPRPLWTVVCSTEEEWQQLAESFKKSKHKDEKMLYETLSVDFVPEIGKMIEAKVLV